MGRTVLRSEGSALGGPSAKEAELDREVKREELVCPSPGPWWTGVRVCSWDLKKSSGPATQEVAGALTANSEAGKGLSADRKA